MTAIFRKRTFSLVLLARSSFGMASALPALIRARIRPTVSAALREKVMLSVTLVNECRYCLWVHTDLAMQNGVSVDDVRKVIEIADQGHVEDREAVAVLYAQEVAITELEPGRNMVQALESVWSARERSELEAYVQLIYFSNLCGNCADAWLARFRGQRVETKHPWLEGLIALISAPSLLHAYFATRNTRGKHRLARETDADATVAR